MPTKSPPRREDLSLNPAYVFIFCYNGNPWPSVYLHPKSQLVLFSVYSSVYFWCFLFCPITPRQICSWKFQVLMKLFWTTCECTVSNLPKGYFVNIVSCKPNKIWLNLGPRTWDSFLTHLSPKNDDCRITLN